MATTLATLSTPGAGALRRTARPLKVLHVIPGLGAGGAESMLASLVCSTDRPDIAHSVVSLMTGGIHGERLRAAGVSLYELSLRPGRFQVRILPRLAGLIRELRPDVVQGWLYYGDLAALMAVTVSGVRGQTKLAWSVRCSNMDLDHYSLRLRLALRLSAAFSGVPDVVTFNSQVGVDHHRARGYRPRRTAVLINGIDTDRFRPDPGHRLAIRSALGVPADAPVVAHVARVDPMKDHDGFLAAMTAMPTVHALLIGAGTEKLAPRHNLHRLGYRNDVSALLCAADVIVSSSAFGEGFSNALAEGMAAGLAPVATDVGDARRIVGDTGIIVPPRDPAALSAAIQTVFDDGPAPSVRGHAARARITSLFALRTAITGFADLYADLTAAREA